MKIRSSILLPAMLFFAWPVFLYAQKPASGITETSVLEAMQVLAGDSLRGRGNGSPDLLKAGDFILQRFRRAGLQPLPGFTGLFHAFQPSGGPRNRKRDDLEWNGKPLSGKDFLYLSADPGPYAPRRLKDFVVVHAERITENMLLEYDSLKANLLIWTSSSGDRDGLGKLTIPSGEMRYDRLFVYAAGAPDSILLSGNEKYFRSVEYNIVGMLPGRSKPEEYIAYSAHYDHEGITRKKRGDRIMNGANDNASGTTAMLMLADWFSAEKGNDRTIIFCAFAGEELGLLGSSAMAGILDPQEIKAGINLEMLGIPQYGKGTVFITGTGYSSLPGILQTKLEEQGLKVVPEPAAEKELYMRSDNYPFAVKGVPFHTIMASDDDDPCYHRPCDELQRIDIKNLTFIIRALAQSGKTLINGDDLTGRARQPD